MLRAHANSVQVRVPPVYYKMVGSWCAPHEQSPYKPTLYDFLNVYGGGLAAGTEDPQI